MAANGLKMEPGLVKNEPGMDDMEMADIDEVGGYEDDTGELIFPKALQTGWLVRVPKDLWTMLSQVDDDQEVQLGEVRVWKDRDVKGKETETIRLNLNPQIPKTDLTLIPKQYDLTSQVSAPKNTFVFSEKNLPGFRPRHLGGGRASSSQDILRSVDSREGSVKIEKRGPRTIPKRTEYLGAAEKELVCTPRDNTEYRHIETLKRAKDAAARTSFINDETAAKRLHNEGMQTGLGDENFIYTGITKKRAQENKATRMPESALIDALQKAFQRYKFWPMSSLKKEFQQPEAWLKEVLGKIAVLVRTGQAANYYMLRPENQDIGADIDVLEQAVKSEELAPEVKGEDDEDDEDVDFEDV
jgi:transcription initiation factor TFIIF subunit beta